MTDSWALLGFLLGLSILGAFPFLFGRWYPFGLRAGLICSCSMGCSLSAVTIAAIGCRWISSNGLGLTPGPAYCLLVGVGSAGIVGFTLMAVRAAALLDAKASGCCGNPVMGILLVVPLVVAALWWQVLRLY